MMKCRLCRREVVKGKAGLCRYHDKAYRNLEKDFEKWRHAYGKLDWKEYLQKVAERPETGIWVKECCELFKDEGQQVTVKG